MTNTLYGTLHFQWPTTLGFGGNCNEICRILPFLDGANFDFDKIECAKPGGVNEIKISFAYNYHDDHRIFDAVDAEQFLIGQIPNEISDHLFKISVNETDSEFCDETDEERNDRIEGERADRE